MRCHNAGLGSSPVARHYWGNHYCFLFLEVLRCFSSLRLPHCTKAVIITLQVIGLSHSEISGSKDICSYPKLIAAYHVLHRLREPRHPPEALTYFRHNQLILLAVVEISRHLHILKHRGKQRLSSILLQSLKTLLQSCVSICQRSLSLRNPDSVGGRIGYACRQRVAEQDWLRLSFSSRKRGE